MKQLKSDTIKNPQSLPALLVRNAQRFGDQRVALREKEFGIWQSVTWRQYLDHVRNFSLGLIALGLKPGQTIGIIGDNRPEWIYSELAAQAAGAIPFGIFQDSILSEVAYIIDHSEATMIVAEDQEQVDKILDLTDQLPRIKKIIYTDPKGLWDYEEKDLLVDFVEIERHGRQLHQKDPELFKNNIAAIKGDDLAIVCYTSGTTGNPKGVLYSHRSNVLHGLTVNQPDVFGLTSEDAIVAIVPMFHANAWALTYAAPAAGAKLVMPGAGMDGKSIYELLEDEKVTATAAVPTVWLGLLQYLDETGKKLPYLQKVVIGGAACPPMMIRRFENDFDVEVIHGWGMTEMSPIGTTGNLKHSTMSLDREARLKLKEKQGRTPYLVEMKIVDDDGNDLPRDGKVFGHLLVRGPAVSKGYFKLDDDILTEDGWFDTGDIATIDPLGFMQITDRDKDVIKSGGEWISSIEIENEAVGCPGVAEAAVIGLPHPRWSERPLLVIIRDAGSDIDKEGVLGYLDGKIAKWWMPDDVVFVDEIPHTATGKIQKMELREQFKDFKLED